MSRKYLINEEDFDEILYDVIFDIKNGTRSSLLDEYAVGIRWLTEENRPKNINKEFLYSIKDELELNFLKKLQEKFDKELEEYILK